MKFKAGLGILVLMMISIVSAHAQSSILPCGGDDPDATCPLDTWVIVLVVASAVFVSYRLYRRQTASLPHGGRS